MKQKGYFTDLEYFDMSDRHDVYNITHILKVNGILQDCIKV